VSLSRRIRALGKRKASVNPDAVQELLGYLETNKKQFFPVFKKLLALGRYTKDQAAKVIGPEVQRLSRRYYAQYGDEETPYQAMFSAGTLKIAVDKWIAQFEKDVQAGRYKALQPKQSAADDGRLVDLAPEVNDKDITGKDLYNLRLLAQRFCDGDEWQWLFDKQWETRSDLVQELEGYIPQDYERRNFRDMVDQLWVRNAKTRTAQSHVPQWVKKSLNRENFKGPNGNEAIGYEWRWHYEPVFDKREDGLVDKKVSDWDRAEKCKFCKHQVVHVYWVRTTDKEIYPVGGDCLNYALGYPRELNKSQLNRIKQQISDRKYAEEENKRIDDIVDKTIKTRSVSYSDAAKDYNYFIYQLNEQYQKNAPSFIDKSRAPVLLFVNPSKKLVFRGDELAPLLKNHLPSGWKGPYTPKEFRLQYVKKAQ
jgi:hypothetical protein